MGEIVDPDPAAIASPVLRRLYAYWQDKRGDRLAPARADLQPHEMRDLLPSIFLVNVEPGDDGGRRFFYRLIGTRIAHWSGGDATGRYMDDPACGPGAARLIDLHETVVASFRPVLTADQPALFEGSAMRFDRLLLPLSGDGSRVDMILGGADGRSASRDA